MNQSGANTKMAGHPGSGGEPSHPGSANRAAKQQSNSILNARQSANASASPRQVREADVANSLLSLERDARQAESESELGYVMVNGSRVAVQYRQALLLLRHGSKKFRVESVSSLSAVDRNSTFIRWVEGLAKQHLAGENGSKVVTLDIRNETGASNLDANIEGYAL